ncbi:MAG: response regulator [Crocinitomicaceae bacterium]
MSKLDVFIIDDSEINNAITKQIASQHNRINNISTYTDAIEALSVMVKADENKQKLPDLILLDIQMPEMNGYEWLDEIDEHFDDPNFVVIFVSGTNYQKDFESFEKQRLAKELLPKPITRETFDKIITDYFA